MYVDVTDYDTDHDTVHDESNVIDVYWILSTLCYHVILMYWFMLLCYFYLFYFYVLFGYYYFMYYLCVHVRDVY